MSDLITPSPGDQPQSVDELAMIADVADDGEDFDRPEPDFSDPWLDAWAERLDAAYDKANPDR